MHWASLRVWATGMAVAVGIVAVTACGGRVESSTTQPVACDGNGVSPGSACDVKGDTCWSDEPLYCSDVPPPCTCDGKSWQCETIFCPACPSPSSISDGASCSDTRFDCPATMTCGGDTFTTTCSCVAGSWSCGPQCGGGPPPPPPLPDGG